MAAVSALLTVTSTMPASSRTEGFSDNANWSRRTVWSPSKTRRPQAACFDLFDHAWTRQRRNAAPPAASMPPTKQPMLPAPAIPIVWPETDLLPTRCTGLQNSRALGPCLARASPPAPCNRHTPVLFHAGLGGHDHGFTRRTQRHTDGPRGPSTPSAQSDSGSGMSPMTMAILALLAWKGIKHFTGNQPGSAPRPAPAPAPGNVTAGMPGGGAGGMSDMLKGGLGGLLAGGAAGTILSGGLGDLLETVAAERPWRSGRLLGQQRPQQAGLARRSR